VYRLLNIVTAGLFLLVAGQAAHAHDYCFNEAGAEYGISPTLLWTISKQESAFNPRAINFNKNGTYDYCHMQINSSWASIVGENIWASLADPCQCTKAGAWILSQCFNRYGYTWEAVGCYHARNSKRRVRYAWIIYNSFGKLF
jgi:soluble lytic murein transglycosylase-like protein